ncbi:hypothetical protein [Silvanigrella sp.]|jgi:hypothetical protein|uniref:hypothetical protein n=1 Tax=Silvanigrella sp. TaxID=2024976 RepID=UPI0037C574D6
MYQSSSFFMLRNPIFPINYFIDYINSKEDILEYLLKQSYYLKFKESILVSSKSLFDSLIFMKIQK